MFESFNTMTVCAAILCPAAACISDVINKAGMCGKSAKNVTSQPFLLFVGNRQTKNSCALRGSDWKQERSSCKYAYS